jgi:hypothetical protein
MNTSQNSLSLTITSGFLTITGWGGLYLMIFELNVIPDVGPRWLFFVLWLMALTGSAIPFVRFLNQRFAGGVPAPTVLLRQGVWVGFFGATCAWLQLGRTLSLATALLLAAGLGGVEWFLRMRERSRWSPDAADESA